MKDHRFLVRLVFWLMIALIPMLQIACESQNQGNRKIKTSLDLSIEQDLLLDQQIIDQQIIDQQIVDQQIIDQQIIDQQIIDQQIVDQQIIDQQIVDQQIVDQQIVDQMLMMITDQEVMIENDVFIPSQEGLPPCDPPLSAIIEHPKVSTLGMTRIYAQGGSGHYELSLLSDLSIGALASNRPLTYLAGRQGGVVDHLLLSDLNCADQVDLSIEVLPSLQVQPRSAGIPPFACIDFTVQGGSGDYHYQIISAQPLGQIDQNGNYLSNGSLGEEVIRVTDQLTQERIDLRLTISPDKTLDLGGDQLFLLQNSTLELPTSLGDGRPEIEIADESILELMNGRITAKSIGETQITVRQPAIACLGPNRDQSASASASIKVLAPLPTQVDASFVGSRHRHRIARVGDLNDDQQEDFVLTDAGGHWGGRYSGGGGLYLSQVNAEIGMQANVQYIRSVSWTGQETDGRWGEAIAIADFNADGKQDIAISASTEKRSGVGTGLVYLYFQQNDNLKFTTEAQRVLSGLTGDFNAFGASLSACDFNGDGQMDLAIGAPDGISADPYLVGRGYVSIFYGEGEGLSPVPRQMLWGIVPDRDQWKGLSFMHFGSQLSSGDFNGDGICDLAVQSNHEGHARDSAGQTYDPNYMGGVVMIYEGRMGQGLMGTPGLHWTRLQSEIGFSNNNRLGAHMILKDLDGDQKAELITGIAILKGRDFPNIPMPTPLSMVDALWTSGFADSLAIDLSDVNADGLLDLLIGDRGLKVFLGQDLSQSPNLQPFNQSFNNAYSFRSAGSTPANHNELPLVQLPFGGGNLGASVLSLGNHRFVLSDTTGPNYQLGAHWIKEEDVFTKLDVPLKISDGRVGASVALTDLTEDGQAEIIVGAPGIWAGSNGYRYSRADRGDEFLGGGAMIYFLDHIQQIDQQNYPLPEALLDPYRGYWVRFGQVVSGIGDFDGDGHRDLAVVNPDFGLPNPVEGAWPFIRCQPSSPIWVADSWQCPMDSQENRWSGIYQSLYDVPNTCQQQMDNTGSIDLYASRNRSDWQKASEAGGKGPRPTWSLFGAIPQAKLGASRYGIDYQKTMVGDFDFNGDGLKDIAIGAPTADWQNRRGAGLVSLFFGRHRVQTEKTQVHCQPDLSIGGDSLGGALGWTVEGLRDLDADGCDELIIGAPGAPQRDNWNASWQGRTFVLFGFGQTCARQSAQVLALSLGLYTASFGWAIDVHSTQDDNQASIAISAPYALSNGLRRGVVGLLSRQDLKSFLERAIAQNLPMNVPNSGLGEGPTPMQMNLRFDSPTAIWGEATKERISIDAIYSVLGTPYDEADHFGGSLAWVPKGNSAILAIGTPRKDFGAMTDAGEVGLWQLNAQNQRFSLVGKVIGQTQRPGAYFASNLTSGVLMHRSVLLVGAPYANANTQENVVENGAVYLIDLGDAQ